MSFTTHDQILRFNLKGLYKFESYDAPGMVDGTKVTFTFENGITRTVPIMGGIVNVQTNGPGSVKVRASNASPGVIVVHPLTPGRWNKDVIQLP